MAPSCRARVAVLLVVLAIAGAAACSASAPASPAPMPDARAAGSPARGPAAGDVGAGARGAARAADAGPAAAETGGADGAVPAGESARPLFGEGVRSLRARRRFVPVRAEARRGAALIGTLEAGARVAWRAVAAGGRGGCRRWVELEPRGFVCESDLAPSPEAPDTEPLPRLAPGALVPGPETNLVVRGERGAPVYASPADAAAGKAAARVAGPVGVSGPAVTVGGRRYLRIAGGFLLPAGEVERRTASRFAGVRPGAGGAPPLPLAWLQRRGDPRAAVPVRSGPAATAPPAREAPPRVVVPVLETSADGSAVRVGEGEWVAAEDARIARRSEPPPGARAGERWVDADLDERVLVAYEGETAVFATLFSPGTPAFRSPTGVWRIDKKVADRFMGIDLPGVVRYGIPHVAWVQYYQPLYALHVSYWHDEFGEAASHGCLNLSPADARHLFGWAPPALPAGWAEAYADAERPGLLIRVRSRRDPAPAVKGYARRVGR